MSKRTTRQGKKEAEQLAAKNRLATVYVQNLNVPSWRFKGGASLDEAKETLKNQGVYAWAYDHMFVVLEVKDVGTQDDPFSFDVYFLRAANRIEYGAMMGQIEALRQMYEEGKPS